VIALEKIAEPPDFPGADGNHQFVVGGSFHFGRHANHAGQGRNS
jgi:hypothetical protein